MSKLSSMTSLFVFTRIGTVLVFDIFKNSNGLFFKSTSLISTLSSQINNPNIHLSALLVEDKIIAVHMGYLYKKNFFYILPAYDYNYKKLSVGNILLLELFENFKQNLNTFDFTIGEEIGGFIVQKSKQQ